MTGPLHRMRRRISVFIFYLLFITLSNGFCQTSEPYAVHRNTSDNTISLTVRNTSPDYALRGARVEVQNTPSWIYNVTPTGIELGDIPANGEKPAEFQFSVAPDAPLDVTGTMNLGCRSLNGDDSDISLALEVAGNTGSLGTPSGPYPEHGATGVPPLAELSWSPCANADAYDLYFALGDAPLTLLASPNEPFYSFAAPLPVLTQARWQVVAKNAGGEAAGAVWNFTTQDAAQASLTVISVLTDPAIDPMGRQVKQGVLYYDAGTPITVSVESSIYPTTATRHLCQGWTGTGSVPAEGEDASVSFTIQEDSSIRWRWLTEHHLATAAVPPEGGVVTPSTGWQQANKALELTAKPSSPWYFHHWRSTDFSSIDGAVNQTARIIITSPGRIDAVFEIPLAHGMILY